MRMQHLSIRKTETGRFVLVQWDKTQKIETETHASADLEEIIDRLLDRHEKTGLPAIPARNYWPVLEISRNLSQRFACLDEEGFPVDWTDALDLYGCLVQELARFGIDMDAERKELAGLVFDRGPEWVWKNRLRLVAERVFSLSSDWPQE